MNWRSWEAAWDNQPFFTSTTNAPSLPSLSGILDAVRSLRGEAIHDIDPRTNKCKKCGWDEISLAQGRYYRCSEVLIHHPEGFKVEAVQPEIEGPKLLAYIPDT